MKKVAIIQARMTSTRLPGKVLMDLAGQPMLSQQLKRLSISLEIDELVIATTINPTDDPIIELCNQSHIRWFRGSENDVLSRYVGAAKETQADIVIRITSDCPLIDAQVADLVIRWILNHQTYDYAANILERTYPRGLDVEVFSIDTLLQLDHLAKTASDREHVTSYIRGEGHDTFKCWSVKDTVDNSGLRWTVDTETDLKLIRTIYSDLKLANQILPYHDILRYVKSRPELAKINVDIKTWDPTSNKSH
jgi:spore coat polysaccharide biosynthesis protein SpsF